MSKIIIGIHGLANKPDEATLQKWWHDSIKEGLSNCGYNRDFKFKIVFWADRLHFYQQHRKKAYSFDDLYNSEPYVKAKSGALVDYKKSLKDWMVGTGLDLMGDAMDLIGKGKAVRSLSDPILKKVVPDLDFYYDPNRKIAKPEGGTDTASKVLKNLLTDTLREHADDQIMLVAHSMGSIISYDVLRDIGRSKKQIELKIKVPHFVTIGSPLGIWIVKDKIVLHRDYNGIKERLRTPTIVTKSWMNFADRRDFVAVDAELEDEYTENRDGISVVDDLVRNDYHGPEGEKKANPHKSYGYLRTPEFSNHVKKFLRG